MTSTIKEENYPVQQTSALHYVPKINTERKIDTPAKSKQNPILNRLELPPNPLVAIQTLSTSS